MSAELRLRALEGLPEIGPGDDLPALLAAAVPEGEGILVVAQKIVSKAEGRIVALADVKPSARALELAPQIDKDPRQVELVLRESVRIVRQAPGVLITETHHGIVCANSGVDLSNAPGEEVAVLLPEDPDASAARIRGVRFGNNNTGATTGGICFAKSPQVPSKNSNGTKATIVVSAPNVTGVALNVAGGMEVW